MGICYIVGAAPTCAPFFPEKDDFIIAADGGQAALSRLSLTPHLVVGDFDSSAAPAAVPYVKHPVEKDDTDCALAIREGRARGYHTFALFGCLGGRLDHTLGAVQTALGAAKEGATLYLVGEGFLCRVLTEGEFTFTPTGKVSVLALSERAEGVGIAGLKYSLTNAVLTNAFPLGVSNEGQGIPATVSVKTGALLILWEGDALPKAK